ncbi:TPA: 30S ribosomal protein S27ae [Candidatus Woesearchaeota archaeon]|nr:30S ribosomal protein S27ae [Candidatus Woesearchaeota archaeon]
MAKVGGAPKPADKGAKKGAGVKKEGKKLSSLYDISGESIKRKNKFCPKCGPGTFLGMHANRVVCGKCAYVEYMKR